jgi:hypothetical protein
MSLKLPVAALALSLLVGCASTPAARAPASRTLTLDCMTGDAIVPSGHSFTLTVPRKDFFSGDEEVSCWFVTRDGGERCKMSVRRFDEEDGAKPFSFDVELTESRQSFKVRGENFNEGSGRLTGKTNYFATPKQGTEEAQATCTFG